MNSKAARRITRQRKVRAAGPTPRESTVHRVASAVLALADTYVTGGFGGCVPISEITAAALRHYGLTAQAVPVEVGITGVTGLVYGTVRSGGFAGHAAVRVKLARRDLIVDLAFGQFRAPGIEPGPAFIAGARPGALDVGPVTMATPQLRPKGIASVTYTVRPGDSWDRLTIAAGRAEVAGAQDRSDRWHLDHRREQIAQIADRVVEIADRI